MIDKFQNKYRIPSARWQNWDYGSDAAYFITICTKNREHYFGEIKNGKMHLSRIGVLADVFWHEIKNHSKNIELGAFVVMPNHIHGILILNGNNVDIDTRTQVETRHALSLPSSPSPPIMAPGHQRFQNQGKNTISSIIGSYKSAISKHAQRFGFKFEWQSRFYDHIIRDEAGYSRISEYIETNPTKWRTDKFFKKEDQD